MKTNSFLRKLLFLTILGASISAESETLYYGGDCLAMPGGSALNYFDIPSNPDFFKVYDDFVVPSPGWFVHEIFYQGAIGSQADTITLHWTWNIRSGMSYLGSNRFEPGTVVAFGDATVNSNKVAPTAPSSINPLFETHITGLNFFLPAGTYHINSVPDFPNASIAIVHPSRPGGVGQNGPSVMIQHMQVSSIPNFCLVGDYVMAYGLAGNVATSDATINGTVDLQGLSTDESGQHASIELLQGGVSVETKDVTLGTGGSYSFTTSHTGNFDIACRSSHWLRSLASGVALTAGGTATVNYSLINGDIDGDNEVTLADYSALAAAFGSADGDPNWNPNADLDGDGEVTLADYGILSASFGQSGD